MVHTFDPASSPESRPFWADGGFLVADMQARTGALGGLLGLRWFVDGRRWLRCRVSVD